MHSINNVIISSGTLTRPQGNNLGLNSYSYKLAADHFIRFFKHQDFDCQFISHPEIYNSSLAQKFLNVSPNTLHICFRPSEDLRLLQNAFNVAYIFWEFDVLDKTLENTAYLGLFDQIWVSSKYTQQCLRNFGYDNVFVVKVPFDFKKTKDITMNNRELEEVIGIKHSSVISEQPQKLTSYTEFVFENYYLCVLNPWDNRKQLIETIAAFKQFNRDNSGKYTFIIKAIIDNNTTKLCNLNEIIFNKNTESGLDTKVLKNDNIFFISENLSQDALFELYSRSKFLVSFSRCEGFNLPIIEAWLNGVASIHSLNTAMCDYTPKSYPLSVNSEKKALSKDVKGEYSFSASSKPHWYEASLEDMKLALQKSTKVENVYNKYLPNIESAVNYKAVFSELKHALNLEVS